MDLTSSLKNNFSKQEEYFCKWGPQKIWHESDATFAGIHFSHTVDPNPSVNSWGKNEEEKKNNNIG